jgi:hypothetical protein
VALIDVKGVAMIVDGARKGRRLISSGGMNEVMIGLSRRWDEFILQGVDGVSMSV